jgi:hypothetical protein
MSLTYGLKLLTDTNIVCFIKIMVFLEVKLCTLVGYCYEEEGSSFPQNTGMYLMDHASWNNLSNKLHVVPSKRIAILIFIAMKTSILSTWFWCEQVSFKLSTLKMYLVYLYMNVKITYQFQCFPIKQTTV